MLNLLNIILTLVREIPPSILLGPPLDFAMDFITAVKDLPHQLKARVIEWFNAIKCEHLRRNIEEDTTFPVGSSNATCQLTAFAGRLPNPLNGDAKQVARQAIDSGPCLVCTGPEADLDGSLCRVHSGSTLIDWHFNDSSPIRKPADLRRFIGNDNEFHSYMTDSPLRGAVRSLFWALESAVNDCRRTNGDSVIRIRQLLGVARNDPTPGILIRLQNDNTTRHVPTCFDAFDHEHYDPPKTLADGAEQMHGWTRDLATDRRGAPEVVTPEQEPKFVQFVAVLS